MYNNNDKNNTSDNVDIQSTKTMYNLFYWFKTTVSKKNSENTIPACI